MTVDELLTELARRDVVLSVDGDRLLFDAPAGALSAELRAAVEAYRAEIIRRLSANGKAAASLPSATPAVDFSKWVRHPNAEGAIGWEAPDLPASSRWWAWQPW